MTYPDTSFLCALYVAQSTSLKAIQRMRRQTTALIGTSLLFFEFRQSVHFQVFRHSKDANQGYPLSNAQVALAAFQSNISEGLFKQVQVDWTDVHRIAERLTFKHTLKSGHRSFDILHVATAVHLGASEFLTFDDNQRKLAVAEGLEISV